MSKFIINDWAGNVCFHGITFETFEDAWGYIYENVPDEDNAYDDYFVTDKGAWDAHTRDSRYLDPKDPRGGHKGGSCA